MSRDEIRPGRSEPGTESAGSVDELPLTLTLPGPGTALGVIASIGALALVIYAAPIFGRGANFWGGLADALAPMVELPELDGLAILGTNLALLGTYLGAGLAVVAAGCRLGERLWPGARLVLEPGRFWVERPSGTEIDIALDDPDLTLQRTHNPIYKPTPNLDTRLVRTDSFLIFQRGEEELVALVAPEDNGGPDARGPERELGYPTLVYRLGPEQGRQWFRAIQQERERARSSRRRESSEERSVRW